MLVNTSARSKSVDTVRLLSHGVAELLAQQVGKWNLDFRLVETSENATGVFRKRLREDEEVMQTVVTLISRLLP